MAAKYVVVEKVNPSKPKDPKKFYAIAKSDGDISLKELSREIAETSTVNDTDVLAVLNDLTKVLSRHLSHGRIVRMNDFGSFSISIHSEGADAEDKFNVRLIKSAKINFRPGEDLALMLNNMKYEKIKHPEAKPDAEGQALNNKTTSENEPSKE
ncbi:MAG: HU family DNA-binding protein [Bacteroidales bacterium]